MKIVSFDEVDDLFVDAGQLAIEKGQVSVSMLQRTLKTGFARAGKIIEQLVKAGVVKPSNPKYPTVAVPCVTQSEWDSYVEDCKNHTELIAHGKEAFGIEISTDFDNMTGEEFEQFCANVLSKNGFRSISYTATTGDHGVDLIASKDELRYVFQCKRYSSPVGNSAVQEIYSGKSIYDADVAVVITNNYFTEQARSDAKRLRVFLWDRDKLHIMI